MDLTTATPVEIDTAIFANLQTAWKAESDAEVQLYSLHARVGDKRVFGWNRGQRQGVWQLSDREVLVKAIESTNENAQASLSKYEALLHSAAEAYAANGDFAAEYLRRGGWPRAYLVDNADGHVHNTTHCASWHATTRYHWLTELSGHAETEIVELAGERACTICYASAPVDVLKRPSKLEGPEQAKVREAAAARKAERAAKDSLKVYDVETGKELFKTERGATNAVSDRLQSSHWYSATHPSYAEWQREARQYVAAVAARRGVDPVALFVELDAKAAKKVAKERA